MQEQAAGSSGAPPDYEGRIALDPTLLDVERLVVRATLLFGSQRAVVMNWHFSRSFRFIFLNTDNLYLSELHLINLTTLIPTHFACLLHSQIKENACIDPIM